MKKQHKLIQDFLFHCQFEKNLRANTLKAYTLDLNQFLHHLSTNGSFTKFPSIDRQIISDYIQVLLGKHKSKTVKRKIATPS